MKTNQIAQNIAKIIDDGKSRVFTFDSGTSVRVRYSDGFLRATIVGSGELIAESDDPEKLTAEIISSNLIA